MSNFYDQMIWIVVGIVATKCFDLSISRIKSYIYNRGVIKGLAETKIKYQNIVLPLQSAIPHFESDNIRLKRMEERFILPIPEELKSQFVAKFETYDACCFTPDSKDIFLSVEAKTGISGLGSRLKSHCDKVARDFIDGKNGCRFNNMKFGVLKVDHFEREGVDEKPKLKIDLYSTDYYTHRVMRSVYQELKKEKHPICQANMLEETTMKMYNYFTTSIAVNTLLILKNGSKEEVVLTERSQHVINAVGANINRKYISTSEGISAIDHCKQFDTVDLTNCVFRGLKEELGVEKNMLEVGTLKFYDLYIDYEKFEIGFTSSVKAKEKNTGTDDYINIDFVRVLPKQDGHESNGLYNIKFNRNELHEFIKNNEFIPQGLYALRSICARENFYP